MTAGCRSGNKNKTFKPKKNILEGTKQYQLKKYAEATLGSGNLRLAVTLPEGEDIHEWLAVNSKQRQDRGSAIYSASSLSRGFL